MRQSQKGFSVMEIGEAVAVPLSGPPEKAPEKKITVRFDSEKGRCGDEVTLRATTENIDGGKVKFELKQEGSAVHSPEVDLAASAATVVWQSKAGTDKRPEPPFELSGAAAGVSGQAEKTFTLEKYVDVAQETKTIPCSSGVYGWTGKFDVALTSGEVIIKTKVKLLNRKGPKPASSSDPLPDIDTPVTDTDKAAMKTDIEGKLSNKHFLHRQNCKRGNPCDCVRERGCCKIRVRVEVDFVEAGEHHTVNLFQGPGRANATNWTRVKTRDNSYAHETGHLLGWYDEYASGAVGTAPRWKVQAPVVMATGLTVPAEYYWDFRDWLKEKAGEDWAVIAT
jgi:hypothetical protein